MNLLAIDTTTDKLIVALKLNEEICFRNIETNGKGHNKLLLQVIDEIMNEKGIKLSEVDCFGVVVGPGSFTGIRIGVATVNALAFAMQKPIVEITSLEEYDDGTEKTVLMDCRHGNFYAGKFFNNESVYFNTNEEEINSADNIFYFTESDPNLIIKKCMEKAEKNNFTVQARPFYLKKSSAER